MSTWQLQDAKARFSEFLTAALEKGPQIVTRRGVEAAVLVPIEDWRRLQQAARRGLKELLLEPAPNIRSPRDWKADICGGAKQVEFE